MTLVEFLAPVSKSSRRDQLLGLLYYCHRYKGMDALTVDDIRRELASARIVDHKKINVADVLAKSGHYVDSPGIADNRRLWKLTDSGTEFVRKLLGLPASDIEIEHDTGALSSVCAKIKDNHVREYVEESIKCLQINALRASVVFLWSGAIRTIQSKLVAGDVGKLQVAIIKHDPKARKVSRIDDFAYIKDKITLLAALEVGLIDKSEKDTLQEALDLRNRCGHPGKYMPGVKRTSSFIEDVVSIVFK